MTPSQTGPSYMRCPRARLLGDGLWDNATLRDVVRVVAFLADVLARLAKEGTYHRDIKPANLFWWDGGPVLADFELSAISADMGADWEAKKLSTAAADVGVLRGLQQNSAC